MRRVRDKRNLARRLLLFVILTIPFRPIISKSTGPIFAKFSVSVELWQQMITLKLVFRFRKRRFFSHVNQLIGFIHMTEFR